MCTPNRGCSLTTSPFFGVRGPFLAVSYTGAAVTAPALSNQTDGTPTAEGTENATVDTTVGNGTLYWAVVPAAGEATDAQIKAGSGGDIVVAGSQAVSGTGAQTILEITGLEAETEYLIVFLQTSAGGSDSAQAEVALTTTA